MEIGFHAAFSAPNQPAENFFLLAVVLSDHPSTKTRALLAEPESTVLLALTGLDSRIERNFF